MLPTAVFLKRGGHKMREIKPALLALLVCLLIPGTAWAANDSLRLYLSGGGTVTYSLDDIQKITFDLTGVNEETLSKLGKPLRALLLMQNRPNPFQASTVIEYQLPKEGRVELDIYNLNGQLVRSLANETQKAGSHKVSWDGRNAKGQMIKNGLYLYRLKSEGQSAVKKLLIVR